MKPLMDTKAVSIRGCNIMKLCFANNTDGRCDKEKELISLKNLYEISFRYDMEILHDSP